MLSKMNRAGLVLAIILGVLDSISLLTPSGTADEPGPPVAILVVDTILGIITVIAAVVAWRTGSRGMLRLVAGARIISAITALPAFFVDVPAGLKILVGVFVILTVVTVVMTLAPNRAAVPVTD